MRHNVGVQLLDVWYKKNERMKMFGEKKLFTRKKTIEEYHYFPLALCDPLREANRYTWYHSHFVALQQQQQQNLKIHIKSQTHYSLQVLILSLSELNFKLYWAKYFQNFSFSYVLINCSWNSCHNQYYQYYMSSILLFLFISLLFSVCHCVLKYIKTPHLVLMVS